MVLLIGTNPLWRCCDCTTGRLGGLGSSAWERLDVSDCAESVCIFPQDVGEGFLRDQRLLVPASISMAMLLPEGGEEAVERDLASQFLVAQDPRALPPSSILMAVAGATHPFA